MWYLLQILPTTLLIHTTGLLLTGVELRSEPSQDIEGARLPLKLWGEWGALRRSTGV